MSASDEVYVSAVMENRRCSQKLFLCHHSDTKDRRQRRPQMLMQHEWFYNIIALDQAQSPASNSEQVNLQRRVPASGYFTLQNVINNTDISKISISLAFIFWEIWEENVSHINEFLQTWTHHCQEHNSHCWWIVLFPSSCCRATKRNFFGSFTLFFPTWELFKWQSLLPLKDFSLNTRQVGSCVFP